jgi:hypothetical protein
MKLAKPVLLSVSSLALSLSLSTVSLAQPPTEPPTETKELAVTLQQRSVTVDGVTAGGQVVWFGMAREVAEDDVATLVRRAEVQMDDDGDGKIVWDLDREVPLRSIWVAVDFATGRAVAVSPEGYPLRRVSWRGRGLARGNSRSDRVEDFRSYAEVLLVRPGEGAWRLTVGDGSEQDDDGAPDGKLAAALDRMRPLPGITGGTAEPPNRFGPKDVVVLIDPNQMELALVEAAGARDQGVGQ